MEKKICVLQCKSRRFTRKKHPKNSTWCCEHTKRNLVTGIIPGIETTHYVTMSKHQSDPSAYRMIPGRYIGVPHLPWGCHDVMSYSHQMPRSFQGFVEYSSESSESAEWRKQISLSHRISLPDDLKPAAIKGMQNQIVSKLTEYWN